MKGIIITKPILVNALSIVVNKCICDLPSHNKPISLNFPRARGQHQVISIVYEVSNHVSCRVNVSAMPIPLSGREAEGAFRRERLGGACPDTASRRLTLPVGVSRSGTPVALAGRPSANPSTLAQDRRYRFVTSRRTTTQEEYHFSHTLALAAMESIQELVKESGW